MVSEQRRKGVDAALPWWCSTTVLALAGSFLLWAAFPPIGISSLAWLAPLPWLVLVSRERFSTRRPYLVLWLASLVHWLAMLQGIRLAHWLNHFGWLALSAYLAIYLPLFVGLSRCATHRLRIPLALAAPVIWTGLELARGYLFTGFSMGLLGHTQFEHPVLIQIADLFGAYAVSFWVMFVSACLRSTLPAQGRGWRFRPALAAAVLSVAAVSYGLSRVSPAVPSQHPDRALQVALVQSSFNTRFEYDPNRNRETFLRYLQLTDEVRAEHPDVDLIVWPESVFTENHPEMLVDDEPTAVEGISCERLRELEAAFNLKVTQVAERINQPGAPAGPGRTHLLVGTETHEFSGQLQRHYNAALLINPRGTIVQRYYKMHPVMFGEYIPLARAFPFIYSWTPLPGGLTPGAEAVAFEVDGLRLSSSICFESAVPHLIRRQFRTLQRAGRSPSVLVNITHDGWFWGSSILDLQLAGAVFRAVELRRPFLVAANAGISAWIDDSGRIRARGPRQGDAKLVASVVSRDRRSLYQLTGDLAAGLCLAATGIVACLALRHRLRPRSGRQGATPSGK